MDADLDQALALVTLVADRAAGVLQERRLIRLESGKQVMPVAVAAVGDGKQFVISRLQFGRQRHAVGIGERAIAGVHCQGLDILEHAGGIAQGLLLLQQGAARAFDIASELLLHGLGLADLKNRSSGNRVVGW